MQKYNPKKIEGKWPSFAPSYAPSFAKASEDKKATEGKKATDGKQENLYEEI
jgi:hypothetical protein